MTYLEKMIATARAENIATAKHNGSNVPGGTPSGMYGKSGETRLDAKARQIGRLARDSGGISKEQIEAQADLTPGTINNAIARAKDMGYIHYSGRKENVYRAGPQRAAGNLLTDQGRSQ
jgi:hypothetical protein